MAAGNFLGLIDEFQQRFFVVNDLHRASAQNVRRPRQDRVADLTGDFYRLLNAAGRPVGRLRQFQGLDQFSELFAVFRQFDGGDTGSDDRHPASCRRCAKFSGVWPPNCTMTPSGFFHIHDIHHVLKGQRFKIQPVGNVIIGGDRLRVGVDHDRFISQRFQGKGRVHAAIIELDPLADAVGPAA